MKKIKLINTAIEINEFDEEKFRKKYIDYVGKTDSIYTIVLFNAKIKEIKKEIRSRMEHTEKINDTYRRARARKAYYLIQTYLDDFCTSSTKNSNSETNESNIFNDNFDVNQCALSRISIVLCVNAETQKIEKYELSKSQLDLLSEYDISQMRCVISDTYDVEGVIDYLTCAENHDVFRLRNNSIRHLKLGRTKRKIADNIDAQQIDVVQYILDKSKQSNNNKFLIYGVSSKLKVLRASSDITDKTYAILNYDISDRDVMQYIDRMKQSDNLDELETKLLMLQNHTEMNKVIFKKDFSHENMAKLELLFITTDLRDKFEQNCRKTKLDINFRIVEINPKIVDFEEGREKILGDKYGKVIGFTYY